MKKTGLLNSDISYVISKMGHNDLIAIGDCGLPIPEGIQRIDLALVKDIPRFIDVLIAVLSELQIEEAIVANETFETSNAIYESIESAINNMKITKISHEELKVKLRDCKAVIRTGEQTPYANIILKSGVVF